MVSDAPPISLRDAAGWETHILAQILQQRERKRMQHWQLVICSGHHLPPIVGEDKTIRGSVHVLIILLLAWRVCPGWMPHPLDICGHQPAILKFLKSSCTKIFHNPFVACGILVHTHVDLSLPPTPICRFSFECLSTGCLELLAILHSDFRESPKWRTLLQRAKTLQILNWNLSFCWNLF